MREIRHRGRVAAIVERKHVLLAPHIAVLERDHPERRFVSCLCVYSCEVDERSGAGHYPVEDAAAAAREALMPIAEFLRHAERLFDHELAELFCVPLDQVAARREELSSQAAGA